MEPIYIAGVAQTAFARRPAASIKQMTIEALQDVLADAGADLRQIEAAFFSNGCQDVVEGQTNIAGQIALRAAGLDSIPIVNVENACASASTAVWLALQYLRSGAGDVALAIGVEKMTYGQESLDQRMMEAFRGGMDVHEVEATLQRMDQLGAPPPVGVELGHRTAFMDLYATMCRAHMKRFGSTQRQMAVIAAKNHGHSVHNPRAQFRKAFTVEEVLAGRPLSYPLTVPMCSPFADGAAAAILCTERGAARLGLGRSRVKVRAYELVSGKERAWEDFQNSGGARAARRAYEVAGVGPDDIDVAEVHDATAFGELYVAEQLGFCAFGEGGILAESGATTLGGSIPINPSGGLESRGHPIGATGLAQVFELTQQLRGQCGPRQVAGARLALQENGGGFLGIEEGVAVVSILERVGD
ncbi:thiolase C-terminal domain-containing protein [Pseudomonas piscis]|uniref:Thiolase family protein n=1 Tax=Pseudomonas piscis TaxID=2614538 RepID=A0A7X1U4T1_9PSED|nr:beta-ketoacyl synthase N-terminal-like domain-containing protein [Pseudomonas piscis]MQA54298.1 thiolase family protein [Pseudomonas piscis]